jgi:hypothetical protein
MIDPKEKIEAPAGTESAPISTPASDAAAAPQSMINPDDLHDLFAGTPGSNGIDEEDPLSQMRNDPNYSALIRDLEYIAAEARKLFEPAEPSDDLWDKIQSKLPPKPED